MNCIFCEIEAGREKATFVQQWVDAFAIIPLNPVVAGHTIVMPRVHVRDFIEDPVVSGITMQRASELANWLDLHPLNLITSAGREATQSVFHLHIHLVPRQANDGLALPWYSGKGKK